MSNPFKGLAVRKATKKRKKKSQEIETEVLRTRPVQCSTADYEGTIVRGMFNVPRRSLPQEFLQTVIRDLTVTPRSSTGIVPTSYPLFVVTETWLSVPRFYGLRVFGKPRELRCIDGHEISCEFSGRPREYQVPVIEALSRIFARGGGPGAGALLNADCGTGKTSMAIMVACRLKRKCAIVVHNGDLASQWVNRLHEFVPQASVGVVQSDRVEVEGKDFVVFMAQSVVSGRYDKEANRVFGSFGFLVIDEAHHWAARTLSRTMSKFPARSILGLSATIDRKDGLGFVLPWFFGDVAVKVNRVSQGGVTVRVHRIHKGKAREILMRGGRTLMSKTVTVLTTDEKRNRLIAREILEFHRQGRRVIMLSERRKHLPVMRELLVSMGLDDEKIGEFCGETSKKAIARREAQRSRPVLLATTRMAEEGFDEPSLDTLIMATPRSGVEQCVGRIMRSSPGKQSPLVLDLYDCYCGGVFHGMARARRAYYERSHFTVIDE